MKKNRWLKKLESFWEVMDGHFLFLVGLVAMISLYVFLFGMLEPEDALIPSKEHIEELHFQKEKVYEYAVVTTKNQSYSLPVSEIEFYNSEQENSTIVSKNNSRKKYNIFLTEKDLKNYSKAYAEIFSKTLVAKKEKEE